MGVIRFLILFGLVLTWANLLYLAHVPDWMTEVIFALFALLFFFGWRQLRWHYDSIARDDSVAFFCVSGLLVVSFIYITDWHDLLIARLGFISIGVGLSGYAVMRWRFWK